VIVPAFDATSATLLALDREGRARRVWQQDGRDGHFRHRRARWQPDRVWIRSRGGTLWLAESP
jgi:hypothetical protein